MASCPVKFITKNNRHVNHNFEAQVNLLKELRIAIDDNFKEQEKYKKYLVTIL